MDLNDYYLNSKIQCTKNILLIIIFEQLYNRLICSGGDSRRNGSVSQIEFCCQLLLLFLLLVLYP